MYKIEISKFLMVILLAVGSASAIAAPDWSKVPKREIHVFHPGVTPIEWVMKKSGSMPFPVEIDSSTNMTASGTTARP